MRNRDEIKKIVELADAYIEKNPNIINSATQEIFDELDDDDFDSDDYDDDDFDSDDYDDEDSTVYLSHDSEPLNINIPITLTLSLGNHDKKEDGESNYQDAFRLMRKDFPNERTYRAASKLEDISNGYGYYETEEENSR